MNTNQTRRLAELDHSAARAARLAEAARTGRTDGPLCKRFAAEAAARASRLAAREAEAEAFAAEAVTRLTWGPLEAAGPELTFEASPARRVRISQSELEAVLIAAVKFAARAEAQS